ncbi:hypothetical protein [Puniceibacterium confluentis]|uniref:hypothetical protein n=1 Tax=Puniceibacterium confluentis TaxID=1958944 RepID=UPI0011B6A3F3|nr:hypothetical protein [Puniceibacterium confluentis]
MSRLLSALAIVLSLAAAPSSHAAVVSIDLIGGPIDDIGKNISLASVGGLTGFRTGETVLTRLVFDDSVVDSSARTGEGTFSTSALFSFIGQTSGTNLTFSQSLLVTSRDNRVEFNTGSASLLQPFSLKSGIKLDVGAGFFSNPDNLASVVSDLTRKTFADSSGGHVQLQFFNPVSGKSENAIRYGDTFTSARLTLASVTPISTVPLPQSLLFALLGLAALLMPRLETLRTRMSQKFRRVRVATA